MERRQNARKRQTAPLPLAARPFLLPSPSPPSARPPLLLQPAVSRSRHTLTGRAAHGSPPRRPQTPAGDPPLAARPFLLPSPSHPSARPPAFATARLFPEPSHLNGARGPWFAAATTPNARRRPTFGRRLPFPLAGAASFRTAPALAAARRFLLPAPRALSGSRADGRFFMRAQGFARTCRVLPAHVEYY